MPLPPAIKSLLHAPKYAARQSKYNKNLVIAAGSAGYPRRAPHAQLLDDIFASVRFEAQSKGVEWGEWLTILTATMFALNATESLQGLHRYSMRQNDSHEPRPLAERVERACLMREVGLKCLGLIGIPKAINNLAALRTVVDSDSDLADALPSQPRRDLTPEQWEAARKVGSDLFDDIYLKQSKHLQGVLAHSHPDLGVFILQHEYGPLFAPPPLYHGVAHTDMEPWEVNRIRVSLLAIASLHAQGGVGPQVTSHIYGLLRSRPSFEHLDGPVRVGLDFLASAEGAVWVLETINRICEVVDGAEDQDREGVPNARL